jgi:DivIVA domain-containing protein
MVDVIWLWALVTVGVIGAIAVVASGRWGSMADVDEDRPDALISAGSLTGEQIKDVRFTHSVRGYRQDEVDTLLDLVAAELDRRESLLRQANIGVDQSRAETDARPIETDAPASGAGHGDVSTPAARASDVDEDGHPGYPWDEARSGRDDVSRSGDDPGYRRDTRAPGAGRTAEPPPMP